MKVITEQQITNLGITPAECVEWIEASFKSKPEANLPPKTWMHFPGDIYINTMPCFIPSINRYGVKVVSRHPGLDPALKSTILLVDMSNGDTLACLEAIWITAMRTGAVEALAGKTFVNKFEEVLLPSNLERQTSNLKRQTSNIPAHAASFGFIGLGNMAHATFECLQSQFTIPHDIWLMRYKDHAEKFIEKYESLPNVRFHVTESREELVGNTDALYSCVTVMNEQFLPPEAYPPGYTLIPVHMRGFQDCDTKFDRIFGDDRGYLEHFDHFNEFRYFGELTDVLLGRDVGRRSPEERILCYNVGLGLHDVWFASRIYDRMNCSL